MKLNELVRKDFVNVAEWKAALAKVPRFSNVKRDAYDENVMHAFDGSGHVIGYFNLQESYGEITK